MTFYKWYGRDKSLCSTGKKSLLHKNFDFLKNVVRNFNIFLGYTIFTLISIIRKSLKKESLKNFPF